MTGQNRLPDREKVLKNTELSELRKWLTKEEVMALLCVSKTVFYSYMKHHGLKSSKVGGIRRFYEDDIHEFLMRHRK